MVAWTVMTAPAPRRLIYGFFFLFDLEPANGWRPVRVGARFDFEVALAREESWFSLQSRKPNACVLTKENLAQF